LAFFKIVEFLGEERADELLALLRFVGEGGQDPGGALAVAPARGQVGTR
jgi:hypothetical protein